MLEGKRMLWRSRKMAVFPQGNIPAFLPAVPSTRSFPPLSHQSGHCTYWSSRRPEPAGLRSSLPRTRRHRRRGTCLCGSAPAASRASLREEEQEAWGSSTPPLPPPAPVPPGQGDPRTPRDIHLCHTFSLPEDLSPPSVKSNTSL